MKNNLLFFLFLFAILFSHLDILHAAKKFDFANWNSNFTVSGRTAFDYFGHTITSGDINGDGAEDLIVGAYYADPLERNGGGCVYVFFGKGSLSQQSIIDLAQGEADLTFYGPNDNSQLGKALAIGNVNNDAYDDMLIGAPYYSQDNVQLRGAVYVILGRAGLSGVQDLSTGGFDCQIIGDKIDDQLGLSLLSADLNNDNYDDIIIGAPHADQVPKINCGKVYIFWGGITMQPQINLASQSADLLLVGDASNDKAGFSLATGNFGGNSAADLIVGAPSASINAVQRPNAGKIYLIHGKDTFFSSSIDLETSTEVSTKMYGGLSFAAIGNVTAAGDVNGDNYDDILFTDFAAQNNKGAIAIMYGSNYLAAEIDFASSPYNSQIINGDYGGILGISLFSSKFDDDSYSDILIGVPNANTDNGNSSGLMHVVLGKSPFPETVDLDETPADETYFGAHAEDNFGMSITILNFNQDSKQEVAIGAPTGGNNAGQIYTVFGGLPYILNKTPYHKSQKIEVNTTVTFDLYDDHEGIDLNSILVLIGGIEYTSASPNFSYTGNASLYSITITPVNIFGYDQLVDVTVNCTDLSGWKMPTESYYFRTKEDTDAPYTSKWIPAPDSINVAVDANITFHFHDGGEGVNINTVLVGINGINYTVADANFSYEGSPQDYYIQIDPSDDFHFGEKVNVSIDGADNAGNPNIMHTFRYGFTCVKDTIPPVVINWNPGVGDTIHQKSSLNFEIVDNESGLNKNSITFYVDQSNITPLSTIIPNSTGNGYIVQYLPTPENYFTLGDHRLRVVGYDQAATPNMLDTAITIICVPDRNPPTTANHFPAKFETQAATNTIFKVDIFDDLMGVDKNSIQIKLNQQNIMSSPNTNITTLPKGYHVEYQPPDRLVGLVSVSIDVSDLSEPPNVMPTEYYTFTTVADTDPPYLTALDPQPNESNVAEDKNVYLEIHDAYTGVNNSTIVLSINDIDVTNQTSIAEVTGGYSLFYDPFDPFEYDETVKVSVSCMDKAVNPNQLNATYYFFIVGDTIPPYVENMDPEPDEVGVTLNTDIYMEILADGYAVDSSSIRLYVNSAYVTPVITPLASGFGYSLRYDPPTNYNYGQEINISVYANDVAEPPNVMPEFSYSFRCIDDDIYPPFLTELEPAAKNDVSVKTKISFKLLDVEYGIDFNSILFKINNSIITDYFFETVDDPAGKGYFIEYYPEQPFHYGETVSLFIYAQDLSSNHNELSPSQRDHNFVCEVDTVPPVAIRLHPSVGGMAYPNTIFYAEFTDAKSGIDTTSLLLKINNEIVKNFQDTLTQDIYKVQYSPENQYLHGPLMIKLSIGDLAFNTLDTSYVCIVYPDTFPPYIIPQTPKPNSFGVEAGDELVVDILDKGMGLDRSSIQFFVNEIEEYNYNLEFNPYLYNPDSLGYRLKYSLPNNLYAGHVVKINIIADDLATMPAPNHMDSTYIFSIKLPENDIVAIPSTIHPNYGNINRKSKIWITTDESVDDISGRIFNIRGKLIHDLAILEAESKKVAEWDGKDENGYVVSGGIYVYQIKIKSKVHQGSIVVAR